jgi:prophage antirepressor-like protein
MNELKVFQNEMFGSVRMVNVDGKPYAVANDVAIALGYAKPNNAINTHCKATLKQGILTNGGNQEMVLIPQGDILRLAVKCNLEGAEKFESWIFDEVVPSVINNGMYATEVTVDKMLNDPDFAINLLTKLKEERVARIEAEKTNAILMHINKTYTATELAKELGFKSANELNKILGDKKIQFKQNNTWVMYSKYADCGYTEIKQGVTDGGYTYYDRRFTQLGREFIIKLLNKDVK